MNQIKTIPKQVMEPRILQPLNSFFPVAPALSRSRDARITPLLQTQINPKTTSFIVRI